MSKSRPTMRDIAEISGFSLGTVSQALSNRPGVASETRERVLAIAAELGYQARPRASATKRKAVATIGLLMKQQPDSPLPINPFYSYVLSGAERECQRQELNLMYASIEVDECNRPVSWPTMLSEPHVDGILVVGTFLEDTVSQISAQVGQRVVLVDAYAPNQQFDSIVTDNLNGAYRAVSYLIETGHRHIGLIGSTPDSYPSIRERRKGYTRALKHYDINHTYIEDGLLTRDDAYAATLRLLQHSPEITAIFACNDEIAIGGVMNAAQELGLRIPDDLSLIGFDDIDLAQEVNPALTTMHVDKTLMGILGVRQLCEQVPNPQQTTLTLTLSTRLIVRESVRPLVG